MNFVEPIRDRKKIAQIKKSTAGTTVLSRSIDVRGGDQYSIADFRLAGIAN